MTPLQSSQQRSLPSIAVQRKSLRRVTAAVTATVTVALHLLATPVQADPFRTRNPQQIGANTERAFLAMFKEGNYQQAETILRNNPDRNEPLSYALKASLAYLNTQGSEGSDPNQQRERQLERQRSLEEMRVNAAETLRSAQALVRTNPLRGNLYLAVGHFLEGAYTFSSTENRVAAVPQVLSKLQQVFGALSEAEKIDPNDPELNLIKGYMDLMLAVNLPFADVNAAIERLRQHAAPDYLKYRGIAVGYRDLRRNDDALTAVNRAIALAPDNPDLFYLRAQIRVRQQRDAEALQDFRRALERQSQLPRPIRQQLVYEDCRAEGRVNQRIAPNTPQDNQNRQECRTRAENS